MVSMWKGSKVVASTSHTDNKAKGKHGFEDPRRHVAKAPIPIASLATWRMSQLETWRFRILAPSSSLTKLPRRGGNQLPMRIDDQYAVGYWAQVRK